jgi:hypothetical protein
MSAPLFSGTDAAIVVCAAATGAFLSLTLEAPAARFTRRLGTLSGFRRGIALFRYEPFWMKPQAVTRLDDVPADTQLLLAELESGDVALVVPLLGAPFRVSLRGTSDGLVAIGDTGDPSLLGAEALLAYVAVGRNLHELMESGSAEVAHRLGTLRLRRDDEPPDFVDRFG